MDSANLKEELVVIGNGPSFNDTIRKHEAWLQNKRKMCVNSFCLTHFFSKFKPEYYVLMDPGYWEEDSAKYAHLCRKMYKTLVANVRWPMNIFIPMEANKYGLLSTIPQKNSFIKIVKINLTEIWGPEKFKNYCYKKNYAMPPMQTVLVAALYIAINIGYKKIFLVGADQNWHENIKITRRNIITYEDAHFYKPNDTIPTLDTNSNRTAFFSMSNFFITISRVFSGHEELARYSKYMHSLIFNASEKSYIDAYKRIVIPNNK